MIDFPLLPSGEKPVWDGGMFNIGTGSVRVVAYSANFAGWDDDLTELHEVEAGNGVHPIDLASRSRAIQSIRDCGFPDSGSILEIGCSSGFLLHDLKRAFPRAQIVGADIVVKPLERLGQALPGVPLIQMDLLQNPLAEGQFDALVALNVLEHIEDDELALRQMARLLKPGGILILEVPQGPGLSDYFDTYLRHFRRYSKSELARKVRAAGLTMQRSSSIGFIAYAPFFVVKKLNRLRYGVRGEKVQDIEKMVRAQIKESSTNRGLALAFALEKSLSFLGSMCSGIRCTAVSKKPFPK